MSCINIRKITAIYAVFAVLGMFILPGIATAQDVSSKFEGRWEYYPGNNDFVGRVDISDCDGLFCKYKFATRLKNSPCHKTGKLQIVDSNLAISRFLWGGEYSGNSVEWEIQFLIEGAKMQVEVLGRPIGKIDRRSGLSSGGYAWDDNDGYEFSHLKDQWCQSEDSTFEGEYGNKTAINNSAIAIREYTVDCRKLLGGSKPIWAQSMSSIRLENADVMSRDALVEKCMARGWHCEENFSGGDGSAENPYQITSSKDLMSLSAKVNSNEDSCYRYAHYQQTSDIDAKNIKGFVPIGRSEGTPFQGVYDGNGFKISNLNYKFTSQDTNELAVAGLFGYVIRSEGKDSGLRNIHLVNSKIIVSSSGKIIVGGIAAVLDSTVLLSSKASLDISVNFLQKGKHGSCKNVFTGGIVGIMEGSKIVDSRSEGKVSTKVVYPKTIWFGNGEDVYSGGIAAYASGSEFSNTHSACVVETTANYTSIYAGGIVGYGISASIFDSSFTGAVRSVSSQQEDNGHSGSNAGGIAAYLGHTGSSGSVGFIRNSGGQIVRSFSSGRIVALASGETASAGGLVAKFDASIQDAYSSGRVEAVSKKSEAMAGGIVATSSGFIQNVFATGSVGSGKSRNAIIGGCVGELHDTPFEDEDDTAKISKSISFCYYNKSEQGMSAVHAIGEHGDYMYSNVSPLSLNEFTNPANFVFEGKGFHFGKDSPIWYMSKDGPRLIWQCSDKEQCIGNSEDKLSSKDISIGMKRVAVAVKKCAWNETGEVAVSVVILADGTVAHAETIGSFSGTPTGNCAAQEVKKATFRKTSMPTVVTNVFHL